MARPTDLLTPPQVRARSAPGRYADGGGLYLNVAKGGSKSWVFLYRFGGGRSEMGLGGFPDVTLAKARDKARAARGQLADGINPIAARDAEREVPTFGVMADRLVATLSKGWRNEKHITAWKMTLTSHAASLRSRPVNEITTDHVLAVLTPLEDRPETASRLRGRIERVLDAAKARGYRTGENPARWRGHLDHLISGRQKLSRGHHKALPFSAIAAFASDLRERDGTAALALEFAILTAARSNEVLGATWGEIDTVAKVWTVPASRMKAGKEHRVPLSDRALDVLGKAGEGSNREPDSLVFRGPPVQGSLAERRLSTNAMRALLIRMGVSATTHGFRSSFRDWAGEVSPFPRELAEEALAHRVGDATERAYRRGDSLEKRRKLMTAWAQYVGGAIGGNNVEALRRAKA
jgi:integrase